MLVYLNVSTPTPPPFGCRELSQLFKIYCLFHITCVLSSAEIVEDLSSCTSVIPESIEGWPGVIDGSLYSCGGPASFNVSGLTSGLQL